MNTRYRTVNIVRGTPITQSLHSMICGDIQLDVLLASVPVISNSQRAAAVEDATQKKKWQPIEETRIAFYGCVLELEDGRQDIDIDLGKFMTKLLPDNYVLYNLP